MHSFAIALSLLLFCTTISQAGNFGGQHLEWYPDPDYRDENKGQRVPDDYDEEDEEETPPQDYEENEPEEKAPPVSAPNSSLLPSFQQGWGLSRQVYDRTQWAMRQFSSTIRNRRYVAVVDFSKPSSQRRFFLFDLANGNVQRLHVAHGKGSGANGGYAYSFSNRPQSMQSSLGAYKTQDSYYGKHGLQLRLSGLEASNSNALRRGIVMHGANYVSEAQGRAGRSWGCPALDPRMASGVINKIRGGALLLIWR